MRLGPLAKQKLRALVATVGRLDAARLHEYEEANARQATLQRMRVARANHEKELKDMAGKIFTAEENERVTRRIRQSIADMETRIGELEQEIAKGRARHDELGLLLGQARPVAEALVRFIDADEQVFADELRFGDPTTTYSRPQALPHLDGGR